MPPTEPVLRLGGVAEQQFDLGWAEIARVDLDQAAPGLGAIALLVHALAFPAQRDPMSTNAHSKKALTGVVSPVAST